MLALYLGQQGPGTCPVGRVGAAELEAAVIDYLRGLLRTTEIIVATWRTARAELNGLGVTETFALVCLPPLMQALQREHPLLRLEIVVATSAHLEDQLLGREVDLAFMVNPTSDSRLRLMPLGVQETTWLAAPSFRLSSPIRPHDMHHLPIISNPHPSPMHSQIAEWFRSTGMEPPRLSFCNSLTVIAHLVEQGVFVGFLPRKLVETQIENGAIQALASHPPPIRARIYAGYRLAEGSPVISAILLASRLVVDQIDFLEPS